MQRVYCTTEYSNSNKTLSNCLQNTLPFHAYVNLPNVCARDPPHILSRTLYSTHIFTESDIEVRRIEDHSLDSTALHQGNPDSIPQLNLLARFPLSERPKRELNILQFDNGDSREFILLFIRTTYVDKMILIENK